MPTIWWLGSGSAAAANPWVAAFVQRLGELGWVESARSGFGKPISEGIADKANYIDAVHERQQVVDDGDLRLDLDGLIKPSCPSDASATTCNPGSFSKIDLIPRRTTS
jgi:hypothetical protein